MISKFTRRNILGTVATLLSLALTPAARGATVFGVGGSLGSACNIFSIETSTGASTFLVDTGVTCALASGSTVTPNGLAYDFPSNRVYFSDIKAGDRSNLLFVDLDDAVPTPTCASGACAAGGDIAATIDNAAMFEGEYYYIGANTDDLFKASFLADGTADGVPAFVDHISDNTEMYGFGDIVITDAGILGASAARTATGAEQGSCANAGAVDPIEVLLSYVLPAGPLVELKTCDAEPIMSLGFGGEGTLFGNVSTGDPANEIYLVT